MPKNYKPPKRELIETPGLLNDKLLEATMKKKPVEIIQELLDRGADPISHNRADRSGEYTALSQAAANGSLGTLRAMLKKMEAMPQASAHKSKDLDEPDDQNWRNGPLGAIICASSARCAKMLVESMGWPCPSPGKEIEVAASVVASELLYKGSGEALAVFLKSAPWLAMDPSWLGISLRSENQKCVAALLSRYNKSGALTPKAAKDAFAWACESSTRAIDLLPALKEVMPLIKQGKELRSKANHPLSRSALAGQEGCAEWILQNHGADCSEIDLREAASCARQSFSDNLAELIDAVRRARREMKELTEALTKPTLKTSRLSAPRI